MDERDLELLCILEETGNITRAAERLYLTQSALSRRIRAIEQELGAELMTRSRQGIHFTPAGEIALAHARSIRREIADLRAEIAGIGEEVCGTLRAGVSVNYSIYRLPDVLSRYHHSYPKVNLQITTGHSQSIWQQLQTGEVDIAILRGSYPWDGEDLLVETEQMYVVCAQQDKDRPLADYPYIDHSTDSGQERLMSRWMHEQGLAPAPGIRVDSIAACAALVGRGLGWAILPEIALDAFEGVRRPCRFADDTLFLREVHVLCRQETLQLPQVRAFVQELPAPQQEVQGSIPHCSDLPEQ